MRGLSTTWFKQPWLTVLPREGDLPPLSILIENQGTTNDGGIYDADPSDDNLLGWEHAIRTWNAHSVGKPPLAHPPVMAERAAIPSAETAAAVAGGANEATRGIALILKWAPFALAGIGVVGLTALVLAAADRPPAARPA